VQADEPEPGGTGKPRISNLGQRLLTAAILIPILVVSMFVEPTSWSIMACSALATVIAGDEFVRMGIGVDQGHDRALRLRITFAISSLAIVVLNFLLGVQTAMAPILFVAAVAVSVSVLVRKQHLAEAGRHLAVGLGGLMYVPMLACVWPLLKKDFGPEWLFLALALAFGSDTAAYFAGRAFGKHKLYEAVSPKKTVEGSAGGLLGGVAAMLGFGHYWLTPSISIVDAVVLGLLGSALGQIGDLVASMVKRTFGVKDSGNVLPGHGGMLDRVDGLLFVAPLIFYYAWLFF